MNRQLQDFVRASNAVIAAGLIFKTEWDKQMERLEDKCISADKAEYADAKQSIQLTALDTMQTVGRSCRSIQLSGCPDNLTEDMYKQVMIVAESVRTLSCMDSAEYDVIAAPDYNVMNTALNSVRAIRENAKRQVFGLSPVDPERGLSM